MQGMQMNFHDIKSFDINSIDGNFIDNPYPVLENLQSQQPLHYNPDGSVFLTRYADIRSVYQDRSMISDKTETMQEKFGDSPLREHHTTSLVFNDPPYHTIVRKLLAGAFTPRKLAEMTPLVESIVDRILDDIDHNGPVEFVSDFAMRLPTEIISLMLGIPEQHRHLLRGYSLSILGALDPVVPQERLDAGNRAVEEFGVLLDELVEHRRKNPEAAGPGEVLDALIFGEVNGRSLNPRELIQNCIFLLNAGHETTTSLMSNALGILLDCPDQYRLLAQNPEIVDTAVEEILRVESPLQIGNRLATEDVKLSCGTITAGTYVHTSIAAANRDPDQFRTPHAVDFTRTPNKHLAFITGIHVCLGATLARIEGRIALQKLVTRFPNIQIDGKAERLPLARFRGFHKLPVWIH